MRLPASFCGERPERESEKERGSKRERERESMRRRRRQEKLRLTLRSASKWFHLLFPTYKNSVGVYPRRSRVPRPTPRLSFHFFHRICAAVLGGHSSGRYTEETLRVELKEREREKESKRVSTHCSNFALIRLKI